MSFGEVPLMHGGDPILAGIHPELKHNNVPFDFYMAQI